jgi:NAD(P)H-nitrite reductase large subunit
MNPDDKICYCYSVTLRKLVNFARVEKPRRASQMSECFGAGTGCGWCIPFLKKIFDAAQAGGDAPIDESPDDYAARRSTYIKDAQPKNRF